MKNTDPTTLEKIEAAMNAMTESREALWAELHARVEEIAEKPKRGRSWAQTKREILGHAPECVEK